MPRIPEIAPDAMPAELAALLASRPPYNIYRTLANAPTALPGFIQLAGALLNQGELDPRWREMAILRVGALSGSKYEIHQHLRLARRIGLDEDRIERALDIADEGGAAGDDGRLLAFTDSVVRDVKAPDELFEAVRRMLTPRALTELLLTIGFYMMVSRMLENLEVELEQHDMDGAIDGFYTLPPARAPVDRVR